MESIFDDYRGWVIYLVSASSTSASASLSRWGSDWTHSSCNMSHRYEQTHHFYNSTQNIALSHKHTPTYLSAIALWVSGHYCPVFPTFVTLQAAFLEQWNMRKTFVMTFTKRPLLSLQGFVRPWNTLNMFQLEYVWCVLICWLMPNYLWSLAVTVCGTMISPHF